MKTHDLKDRSYNSRWPNGFGKSTGATNIIVLIAIFLCIGAVIFLVTSRSSKDEPDINRSLTVSVDPTTDKKKSSNDAVQDEPLALQSGTDNSEIPHATTSTTGITKQGPPDTSVTTLSGEQEEGLSYLSTEEGEYENSNPTLEDDSQDDPEYGTLSISGRVLNSDGEPVAGIAITATSKNLFYTDEYQVDPSFKDQQRAQSDINGFYEFQYLADGEYEMRTEPTEFYSAGKRLVRAGVDSANLVLVEREQELRVYGIVESVYSELLEGARVVPIGQSARSTSTNEGGEYGLTLKLKAHQQNHILRFAREGFQERRLTVSFNDVREVEKIRIDVQLEPISTLAEVIGSVEGDDGLAVSGEVVQLYSSVLKRQYLAVTNHTGGFSFPEVEIAMDYRLSIHPKGPYRDYAEKDLQVTVEGLYLEVSLECLNHGTLTGRMVDLDGNPVPGFGLWLRSINVVNQQPVQVTGDQGGYYFIKDVPSGDLTFESHSFPLFNISGIHMPVGAEKNVELVLDWGSYVIRGSALDVMGNPVPATEISLSWFHRGNGVRSYSIRKTIADADGDFLFTRLGTGLHTISINAPGFKTTVLEHEVDVGWDEVVVQLIEVSN